MRYIYAPVVESGMLSGCSRTVWMLVVLNRKFIRSRSKTDQGMNRNLNTNCPESNCRTYRTTVLSCARLQLYDGSIRVVLEDSTHWSSRNKNLLRWVKNWSMNASNLIVKCQELSFIDYKQCTIMWTPHTEMRNPPEHSEVRWERLIRRRKNSLSECQKLIKDISKSPLEMVKNVFYKPRSIFPRSRETISDRRLAQLLLVVEQINFPCPVRGSQGVRCWKT